MPSTDKHWNSIFSEKSDNQLGWYESDISQTLKFLENIVLNSNSTVFIPGAGTSQLVDALAPTGCQLILNDISDEALKQLEQRIGENPLHSYLHHNMAEPLPQQHAVDLWIDRAVLHFLLQEDEINGYFDNLKNCVKTGGHVLLAEFSTTGAKKCAGLELHQCSLQEMQQRLGDEFTLLASEEYTFINPFDQERPYIYGLFRRV